ncbi:MAG: DUF1996 domain-containing protein [Actinobacteria bacterium]|nr:DUF1996 domain-containing protein [Actinomycetota bacterium]
MRLASAAAAVVMMLLVACAGDGERAGESVASPTSHVHQHHDDRSLGEPDRPVAGPQGAIPQFLVECEYSHAAEDDPIVYPGEVGASHLHVFFGNTTTDADTTIESLAEGDTTCDQRLDKAAYWAPALLRDGEMITPVKSTAYYRPGIDVDPTIVQPFPEGLVMIAGSAGATEEQPVSIVAWTCGLGIERAAAPPECAPDRVLRLLVTFPDCWDGEHLDSDTHKAHVAYSSKGVCPGSHPVPVPQMQFSVEYPVSGNVDGLELASGGLLTGHADFMNGWDADKLASEVELCLHREVVCGVTSGRKTG